MDPINKLKLAIHEAANEKLIDKDLTENMLTFCESADMNNEEDVAMMAEMTQTLIDVAENALEEPEEKTEVTLESVKLEIYESERVGDITKEERDELLSMLAE